MQVLVEKLFYLLCDVERNAGTSFAGIGVILFADLRMIPVFPMVANDFQTGNVSCSAEFLAEISCSSNKYHDGFHLLSSDWKLVGLSQYFSPPIIDRFINHATLRRGGRYYAAKFGSVIPGVICTGIISRTYGIVIFRNGQEEEGLK